MASFGSTECARNSVASRKACVEGQWWGIDRDVGEVKNGTFFGKNYTFLREVSGISARRMPRFSREK